MQNGTVILNSAVKIGDKKYDSITDTFCDGQKKEFNNPNYYEKVVGIKSMGEALDQGMVLAMSILDDPDNYMLWLDSNYPPDQSASIPGVARGTCSLSSVIFYRIIPTLMSLSQTSNMVILGPLTDVLKILEILLL